MLFRSRSGIGYGRILSWRVAGILALLLSIGMVSCVPAAPSAGQSVADGPATGGTSTEAIWEQTVEAARQEGSVVVLAPPGANVRQVLDDGFRQAYPDIELHYSAGPGAQHTARLMTERQAGQYLADVGVMGTTDPVLSLIPDGALDSIEQALIKPHVRDESNWVDSELDFADEANKHVLVAMTFAKVPYAYKPSAVQPGEITSYRDFLDPKWHGKLVMRDPRSSGPGNATASFWYNHEALGPEFLRALFSQQDVLLLKDDRQILDLVARGERPVAIAPSDLLALELKGRGVPLALADGSSLREGTYLTAGFSGVVLFDRAPHPNAARVYLNWLLSQETQTAWSRATGYASRRADVPRDHLDPIQVPHPGVSYQENYKERFLKGNPQLLELLNSVIK